MLEQDILLKQVSDWQRQRSSPSQAAPNPNTAIIIERLESALVMCDNNGPAGLWFIIFSMEKNIVENLFCTAMVYY